MKPLKLLCLLAMLSALVFGQINPPRNFGTGRVPAAWPKNPDGTSNVSIRSHSAVHKLEYI
jgi:hypothetical protein